MRDLRKYALLAIFATGCVAAEDQVDLGSARAPIIGGTLASVGQYPTVVAIATYMSLCTGTLVGPDLVLTAAHCVYPDLVGLSSQAQVTAYTQVILDTTDATNQSMGQRISAADTIPNPSFTGGYDLTHDIALIRLSQPVTDHTPTPINRVHGDAPVGIAATLVGYGMSNPTDQMSAGKLYVVSNEATVGCTPADGSDDLLLCFDQTNGTGVCHGDSGGPAFVDIDGARKVAGVVSAGTQEDCTQGYTVYTRVDAELAFLDANAPELACQADGLCTEECGDNGLPVDPDCPVCDTAADCERPDEQECIDGFCFALPNTPGGIGYDCVGNDDCDSGRCGHLGDTGLCSEECDPAASTCPDGFDCLAAGDSGACWPSADDGDGGGGGCEVSGSGTTLPGLFLIGLFLLVLGGRRRRAVRSSRRL